MATMTIQHVRYAFAPFLTSQGAEGEALSALDILSSTRLVNYFARIEK